MLLDVGPGTPANFTSLQIPFDEVDKIFLTHHHVDHIGGLDQFWIGGWTYGRRRPLRVWGPPGTADIVAHLRGIYAWDIETRRRVFDSLQGSEIEAVDYGEGVDLGGRRHSRDRLRGRAHPAAQHLRLSASTMPDGRWCSPATPRNATR